MMFFRVIKRQLRKFKSKNIKIKDKNQKGQNKSLILIRK